MAPLLLDHADTAAPVCVPPHPHRRFAYSFTRPRSCTNGAATARLWFSSRSCSSPASREKVSNILLKFGYCNVQRFSSIDKHIDGDTRHGQRQSVSGVRFKVRDRSMRGVISSAFIKELLYSAGASF
ncbi:uncharacterized protein [Triticum aestivum]|uniref:uncharacterized protein n=1 Tax=Triticum aestivum TaxID=4565 RepID=UPI001D00B3B8|nr:uncharacterized protein LOC123135634 [Triticum aestivum]XP_044410725.1 uncharacterized protein LOC123135634 [Triticum aestivum]XP_044410726.1 uncharacterized protein LOC123135634 [Triticum aestivum]